MKEDLLAEIRRRAAKTGSCIVLVEGHDPRVVAAAIELAAIVEVELIAPIDIDRRCELDAAGVRLVDPTQDPRAEAVARHLQTRAALRKRSFDAADAIDPLLFAFSLVALGLVGGAVAGADTATSTVLRAALRAVGLRPDLNTLSSCFLMVHHDPRFGEDGRMIFADCGVVPDPSAEQLVDIAIAAAASFRVLVGAEPKLAMLSFSTLGSAKHPLVDKVSSAVGLLRARRPDFEFAGELQLDAAIVPEVALRKAKGSKVAGRVNTFVFPDLNSGNICYKACERFAGMRALGPLLQGLSRPVNDLSRGAGVNDIIDVACITAVQGGG